MAKRSIAPRSDPIDLIAQVNRGRVPELMRRKFGAMAADPFVFLRATAILGHGAVDLAALPPCPVAWVCGDLHLQNFGCFRGANRLVYFDLNDFDEAARLPVCIDLLRLLASFHCAAPGMGLSGAQVATIARRAVLAYGAALARGKAFWLERDTAVGAVAGLLRQVERRKRRSLLGSRTRVEGTDRRMRIDGTRYLAVAPRAAARRNVALGLGQMAGRFGDAEFFRERDVAFRVAGMGSLGVARYVALVQGKGDPDRNALIDFKRAVPSSAILALPQFAQPDWGDDARRVVGVQDLCQAASPAFLCALRLGGSPFVARELQPVEDRIALPPLVRHMERLDQTLEAMARLAAYAQLRSAGRMGAAGADELIAFGRTVQARPRRWLEAGAAVDAANRAAFVQFQKAWKAGDPRLLGLCGGAGTQAARKKSRGAGAARGAAKPRRAAR